MKIFSIILFGDIMSKAVEYNEKIIKAQQKRVKEYEKKYYGKTCSFTDLNNENKKLFKRYNNLERIMNEELNNLK